MDKRMDVISRVKDALQHGKCFTQGNYTVSTHDASGAGYLSEVFYYGHKVFTYSHHPSVHKDAHKFDFCGYEGYNKTTRLINHCLDAIDANYRVSCTKNKKTGDWEVNKVPNHDKLKKSFGDQQ